VVKAPEIDPKIPELRDGYAEVLAFADFCSYLTAGEVASQASALVQAARELHAATTRVIAAPTPT
jgi:hypothetical protein